MAIKPTCDDCGLELQAYGAILFSPPDDDSTVKKFHLCVDCYQKILSKMERTSET